MKEGRERKSKSQIKREYLALQELGRELIGIPEKLLVNMPLSEDLLVAVLDGKRFRREALRRQIRHIGSLMQHADVDAIRLALEQLKLPHQTEVKAHHEIEKWRDGLLIDDARVLAELCERFPELDRQHVRQLSRNAKKERERNKLPRSSRLLFRYLTQLQKGKSG